jgi:hypothetical protein
MEKIGILKLPPRSSQCGYRPIKPISRDEVDFEPPQKEENKELLQRIRIVSRKVFKPNVQRKSVSKGR